MLTNDRDFVYQITPADQAIYDRILPSDSPLLDALERVDWKRIEDEICLYYCPDRGQPAIVPLIMFKLEVLRYYFRLSDRNVIQRAWTDLLFRYFLQISITVNLPHHTSLTRFRGRLGVEGFQRIFDLFGAMARESGLIRDKIRLKDATHIIANVAIPTALGLLAQLRDRMLAAIARVDAEIAKGFQIDLENARADTEQADDATKLSVRVDLVKSMLAWITEQDAREDESTSAEPAWQQLQAVRALAEKILNDFADPAKGDRTRSVVDPDVRRGKHGDFYDGYLLDVVVDGESELITSINVLPANGDEAADAISLIGHEQATHGNQIEQLSIDGIGFNGAMLRTVQDPEGLNVDVITPPRDFVGTVGFSAREFELTENGSRVVCPAGETSGIGGTKADKPNTTFYQFSRSKCWDCPLRPECCPDMKPTSRGGRRVSKNEYEAEYERARQKASTAEYAEVRRRHPAIERKLNEIVRHGGSRRANYWGRSKVKIQQLMTCLVVNLKRISRLLKATSCAEFAVTTQ